MKIQLGAIIAAALFASPASAAPLPIQPLNARDFQSFVANWPDRDSPFCAAFSSEAEWRAVMLPAPVMGGRRPFAPPAALWQTHTVLMIAAIAPASGDPASIIQIDGVDQRRSGITVATRIDMPDTPSSSTVKTWTAVAVPRPLRGDVTFNVDGEAACTVALTPAQRGNRRGR